MEFEMSLRFMPSATSRSLMTLRASTLSHAALDKSISKRRMIALSLWWVRSSKGWAQRSAMTIS